MKTDKQYIYQFELDLEEIAKGSCLSRSAVEHIMRDGRAISRFSEAWVERIYGGLKLNPVNHKGSDCTGVKESYYSVKSLTKNGSALRLSSNSGKGRTCSEKDVMDFILQNTQHIFVDNVRLPSIRIIALNSGVLVRWSYSGRLRKETGIISHKDFWEAEEVKSRSTILLDPCFTEGSVTFVERKM